MYNLSKTTDIKKKSHFKKKTYRNQISLLKVKLGYKPSEILHISSL